MIYNEKVLQLSYEEELGAVIMEWIGFSSSLEFRTANEAVLQLLKERNTKKILADVRHMKIISLSDQQWLYQDWLPRTIKAGLEYVAFIESEDFFNRLTVDHVVQKINDQLTIKYFNTKLGAKNWIKNL